MARPREFDEVEILDRALAAFWERGFDGTSIEDLVQSTGLGRASLYNAFGDKEKLFKRVVDHYLARTERIAAALDEHLPARETLEGLLNGWVVSTCSKSGPRGCFLLLSGTSGGSEELTREALSRSTARLQKALVALLRRAQEEGDLGADADVVSLARFLGVVQHGLATSARAGVAARELSSVAREAIAHVLGAPRRRS
jgi:AcrR family transcriptional regulator